MTWHMVVMWLILVGKIDETAPLALVGLERMFRKNYISKNILTTVLNLISFKIFFLPDHQVVIWFFPGTKIASLELTARSAFYGTRDSTLQLLRLASNFGGK
jgi:hypothetical protein